MASQKNADQFKDKMNAQAEPRISQQKKAFVGWVNAHLQQRSMNISNLKDISQVSPLIHLLEILEKNKLDKISKHHKKPRNSFDKMEGMIICVQHIKSLEGSNVNPLDAEILLSGKELKIYLALIWRIIIIYSIQKVNNIQPKKSKKKIIKSPEQCLKEWVNIQLLPNKLQINNFTNEWIDGKIFICLMNKAKALDKHNQIKYENVKHMSNKQLLDHILEINEKYLNIPQLLDSNNLINSPNKESIMTYVLLLKAAIENDNILLNNNNEPDVYLQEGQSNEQKDIEDDIGITPRGPLINVNNEELSDEEYNLNNNNVDLAILCDITDSMNEWIDEIKHGIRRIVNELKNTFGIGKLRLSFIGYRDWNDDNNNKGEKRIEKLEFTSIETFESFIKNVKCIGGGDAAEDVLGGIKETLSISWKAPIRVLYHICDAAAHGTMYHNYFERLEKQNKYINDEMSFLDGISDTDSDSNSEEKNDNDNDNEDRDFWDKWPDKHPQDPSHEDLFTELKKNNIQYYIGTQTSFTDKMVKVFEEFCTSIDYRLTPMNLVNVSQFLPTLIKAVSDAIRICIPPKDKPSIKINLEKIKKKKVNFQVHCGIDFGTAGTGFAWALSGKNKVYTDQNWNNSGKHVDVKTKTNILLDIKGNCIAFGDDATDKYIHTDTYENDLFFERFKMALYEKQIVEEKENNYSKTDISQYLTATNGKQLPSRKVLEEALRFMKDHAMNNLCKNINKNLQIKDIQWIITVPAIWSDTAKSIMTNAAIAAGMINSSIDQHLIIAYEPDCASLSILHEINEKAHEQYKQQQIQKREQLKAAQNIEENKNEIIENDISDKFKSFFECGDKILLCDLGGGTADIACHELDKNERICQIVAPSGGAWGSTYVDQYFLALLNDIFSQKWMNQFKIEEPSSFIQLLKNFRDAKKTYKMNDKKKIKSKQFDTTFHNIQIPFEFSSFMEEQLSDDDDDDALGNIVNRFIIFNKNGLIKLDGEYLQFSYTIWNYLFDQVIDCIINHCKKLLDLPEMKSCKFLCLVGGFSQSKYLQTKMFRNFGKKSKYDMQIYTPKRPHLSVVDGAARMGLFPNFISARSIAKTYGIAIQKDLFEFKSIYPHSLIPKVKISKRLVYAKHNKELMISKQVVNDVFLPFVRKNQLIKNNDKPIVYWVEAADVKANKISIRLFSSDEIDPIFVDDNRQADKIEIELSDIYKLHNEPIPVIFIFNDTIIRVFVQMIDNDGNYQTKEISINFDAV